MELTLSVFLSQAGDHPVLLGILALVIGVTIISGATDAPNAIASAVSTRCLTPGAALALAAVFNFVGLVGMTYISTAVAHTMFNMVDFSGNTHQALLALIAAMIGSIGWGVFCWFWGIPASKSHSLIAGVTGGAIALMMDWRIALVVWGGFLILAILTRYVSLGSVWAGASFPVATWFVYQDWIITLLGLLLGGLVVYMHRGNIHRLLTGTENKFSLHKKQ